jgi:acylphosphatase
MGALSTQGEPSISPSGARALPANSPFAGYGADMTVRRRVFVTGRVQGVGFRYAVAERARTRGVHGWVRNLASGQVEAVFEGEPDAVEAMVGFCRRGPLGARVDDVQVADEEPRGEAGFSAR